jgi:hypothetical protein
MNTPVQDTPSTSDFPTAPTHAASASDAADAATNPPPPPPPPTGPPLGPPTARPVTSSPRRPWRQRLPEVVAAVGAVLVVLALAGFVSSTWALLDEYAKALALGIAAAGLTVAGLWADDRRGLNRIVPIVWATATAVTIGAVHVALVEAMPDATRIAIALAGVAGMTHAAVLWQRRSNSILMQLAAVGSAVFAAGPIGTSLTDRFDPALLPDLFRPLAGVFDPTVATDAFLIVAIAHLAIAVAWIAAGRILPGHAAHVARVGGSALLGYAALEFNVLASPIGAAIALIIVLGYLIAGVVLDDVFLVVVGTTGALATGVKVIWSLFTGEVAVTLTIFAVGLVMLGWAYRAAQGRDDN